MKIKIFRGATISKLEERVNTFLKQHNNEDIVEIKSDCILDEYNIIWHTITIILKK